MNVEKIKLHNYLTQIPEKGQVILAQQRNEQILVYQAFNHQIADFAIKNQFFGGNHYSFNRMSWIKPNILWMMFRCGWAAKSNQERVLGVWIDKNDFETILSQAAYSSYKENIYGNIANWRQDLANKSVRLQWDPDHDIHGKKEERRAIQLGLKGNILKQFGTEMVNEIIDMTAFVKEQKIKIDNRLMNEVEIPNEEIYQTTSEELNRKLGLI